MCGCSAQSGSAIVLEHLLAYEGCDVDLQNRLENNTPLHMAVKYLMDPEERNEIVESLLDAGANTKYVLSPFNKSVLSHFLR